ncbi:hypothetical protein [Rhodomicrobium lacus]|uniref:hypothetical protein n=1 Tax=Rhodomicrobium lacus TaxID=2498452 RepID=UPI00247978C4|nr:hypothetical protein [Rhodomicrobium lacus]
MVGVDAAGQEVRLEEDASRLSVGDEPRRITSRARKVRRERGGTEIAGQRIRMIIVAPAGNLREVHWLQRKHGR